MRRPLRFRQIEALRALVEGNTVTRAAELLHVTQPAVSKLLAHLESDCGFPVFDRIQGRLSLTAAGLRVYEEIDQIFRGVHQLEQAVDAIRREEEDRLIVAASPVLSEVLIPGIVIELLKEHPKLSVTILAGRSQEVAEKIKLQEIDVGLIFPNYQISSAFFHSERVFQSPLVCLLPMNHPLRKKKVIGPKDLAGERFISSPGTGQIRRMITAAMHEHGVDLTVVIETTTVSAIADFVAAGIGISLVHPLFAKPTVGKIHCRRFEPELQTEFLICHPRETRNREVASAFVRHTHAVARRIGAQPFHWT